MTEGSPARNVRVRGIYATALTRTLLDAGFDVVQASPPIRRRFDADLPTADHAVRVETSDDRQGVRVVGDAAAVADCRDLLVDTAIDAFAWDDPAPEGAVFDGEVVATRANGAVLALDDGRTEGYLPFRRVDGYVDEGDAIRVQVESAAAPWSDDRPLLDTDLRAAAGLATLRRGKSGVRVAGRDDAAGRELAGLTDLLSTDVPDGWGLEWARDARDAEMATLDDALSRARGRAAELDEALANAGADGADGAGTRRRLVAPAAGVWVWFGRESRFALDAVRREVTATMPGHHRTKAGSDAASAGVDFAEALCADRFGAADGTGDSADDGALGEFPFGVVADQFGPAVGDEVRIDHGKPDGRRIVLGRGEVVERDADGSVAVRREMTAGGEYDALGVPREAGDVALTKFREGRWWYPTTYRDADGDAKGTYLNVCTPVEAFPDAIRYVDLEVDVVKHGDGTVERVDDDDLDAAVAAGLVDEELAEKARSVASSIERAL